MDDGRRFMPRRVWSKVDVPSGWVQIVRGPRPKSEQWPRRVTMPEHQPSVAQKSPVSRPAQVFARSAKEKVNPDVARCAAFTQVQKLEKALEIMGDAEGPAVEALKLELDKARKVAKVPRLSVQITATQEFIKRSEKRLMDLEEERKAEAELLQDAKERLAQLEVASAEATCQCPSSASTHMGSRDGGLEGSFVFCRRRAGCGSPGHRVQAASHHAQQIVDRHPFDANPCAEGSRRLDARSEHGSPGGPLCWQRFACFDVDCEAIRRCSTHVDVDWEWSRSHSATTSRQISLCGLRGVRVGEASHPGPPKSLIRRHLVDHTSRNVVARISVSPSPRATVFHVDVPSSEPTDSPSQRWGSGTC